MAFKLFQRSADFYQTKFNNLMMYVWILSDLQILYLLTWNNLTPFNPSMESWLGKILSYISLLYFVRDLTYSKFQLIWILIVVFILLNVISHIIIIFINVKSKISYSLRWITIVFMII